MGMLEAPLQILSSMDKIWTWMLLFARYSAFFVLVPGIGGGVRGLTVRLTGMMVFAAVSLFASPAADLPADFAVMAGQLFSELLLGSALGFIPKTALAGIELAGQLSANTMGLGAGEMMDPTSGSSLSPVSNLGSKIGTLVFLALGGHHYAMRAVAGLAGSIKPGTFIIQEASLQVLIAHSAHIFEAGVTFAAPIIAALLLTQFSMGLIARAVTSVNIFIISFPITITLGLMVYAASMPELFRLFGRDLYRVEQGIDAIVLSAEESEQNPVMIPSASLPQR